MASRTREKLIETAKQLFIHKGVENTTIGDIASASEKGRRTIYTYFNNKLEIYNAVIENESERMVSQLRGIAQEDVSAAEKLQRFLEARITSDQNSTSSSSILKSLLSMDFGRVSKTKKKARAKEGEILDAILREGVERGEFDAERTRMMKSVLQHTIRALDALTSTDDAGAQPADFASSLSRLMTQSILVTKG